MALTRRALIAAGGLSGGLAAGQALLGSASPAMAGTVASKDTLSVKDTSQAAYGPAAVGDGVADDTAAIQTRLNCAALGFGLATVFFPPGTYKVSSTITVPPNVNIVCGGNAMLGIVGDWDKGVDGTATLLGAQGFSGTILQTGGGIISNLRVAGKTQAPVSPSTPSVLLTGDTNANGLRVEGCVFGRRGADVVRWNAKGIFVGNYIYGHGWPGCVGLRIAKWDSKFFENEITSSADNVLVETGSDGVVSQQNLSYNSSSGAGVHWYGNRGMCVGNRIDENGTAGVLLEGYGNVVTGNCFVLNGFDTTKPLSERAGVRINNGWGNAITGNTFANWNHSGADLRQHYGVSLTSATTRNNSITGNAFTRHPGGAVFTASGVGSGNITAGNAVEP